MTRIKIYGECHFNAAVAYTIERTLQWETQVIHVAGVSRCIKYARSAKKNFIHILLIDLENPEKSPGQHEYVISFLNKYKCNEKGMNNKAGIYLYECESGAKIYLVLFNKGPEEVLRRIDDEIGKKLRDPRVLKRVKSYEIAYKAKKGCISENDILCKAVAVVSEIVTDLLKNTSLFRTQK